MIPFDFLKTWFHTFKRPLPWRNSPTPYQVWVSELMLQQTQVAVVIPYYQRWMERFPTLRSLAEAPLEEVIKLWEGLGYYSRARYLHEGAKQILQHDGDAIFPNTPQELKKIKGIGSYTAGAILSFAFHQKAAALDGNVIRVLARFWGINQDISQQKVTNSLRIRLEEALPNEEPWIISEALIELGAMVCRKKPLCAECPLQKECFACKNGATDLLPYKEKKISIEILNRQVSIIFYKDTVLLRKGEKGKIMADLYEFPYDLDLASVPLRQVHVDIPQIIQSFTRFKAYLYPKVYDAAELFALTNCVWKPISELHTLPFSSGHRKILGYLQQNSLFDLPQATSDIYNKP